MSNGHNTSLTIKTLVSLFLLPILPLSAQNKIDFARDVRPILAKNCFHCHGPDEDARATDLRLDTAESAYADLDGTRAIVPGKPKDSDLINRIFTTDEDALMPPADSKLKLSQKEKDLLRQWVLQGAKYEAHWAFVPPVSPQLPDVKQADWIRNSIDRFVLARLEQEGLKPSPRADRVTLVRRLYLDLIGLPPTPEEADAFVNDKRPDAYKRLVNKLLKSPHYGERWGRLWLDLARYSDTNGYEKDRPRSIWAYRDWVINAFNSDMPFNQFTIEQLAGDLLPNATLEQKIATGFHRNTMLNEEGGVDVEQFRFESLIERINTTGTVWLGMTVGCAQCHTHKYDPITQTEYYQLLAFLNNSDEPELNLPDPEISRKRAAITRRITKLEKKLITHWPGDPKTTDPARVFKARFAAWRDKKQKTASHWTPLKTVKASSPKGTTFTVLDDQSLLAGGNRPNNDVYNLELETDVKNITAIKLEVLPHESLPANGPGRTPITVGTLLAEGDFLLSEIDVTASSKTDPTAKPVTVALKNATHSHTKANCSAEKALDGILDTGWSIGGDQAGKAHHAVFQFADPVSFDGGTRLKINLHQIYIHNMILGRFRLSVTSDPLPVVASGVPADVEAALLVPGEKRSATQQNLVKRRFLLTAPELISQQKQIAKLRKEFPKYETTLVMQKRRPEDARKSFRHHRGEYLKPREEVTPGVPAMLHAFPRGAPINRLTLARWLVDPGNPLVARVVMNRHWQALFGRGFVRTTEDFGTQSSPRTHPQLLDWLATEFVRRGWSLKQMHRLIVSSATYQQQSYVTPELNQRDPDNLLLARGPRFRVEAETIRDIALTAAGLLNRSVGGPSVFPPQPEGVTSLSYGSFAWKTETGPNRYRRGLYTFSKRTTPYAMFGTFDAPSGETCVVKRNRSNTPLQALTVLNDNSFIEAAQSLAFHELTQGPETTEERIIDIFRRFLTRSPVKNEVEAIQRFYDQQLDRFREKELNAITVSGLDPKNIPKNIDPNECAAWTTVVRAVLNFDETITKE